MGAKVDLFDERPSNSFFSKAIIRIKKEMYAVKINQYFKGIIEKIKDIKYDYFLLIKGEATPKFFLDFLKSNNPDIQFIFYTYDSFKNNSNGLDILSYFDHQFTFDSQDALQYKMSFRPLFFAQDYGDLNGKNNKFQNDLAFIGTAHSDRYSISEKAKSWCSQHHLKMFTFYFSPSKLLFKYKRLADKEFKNFDYKNISFRSLSHNEIVNIYNNTKVILDINHPGQNGLTMRTFETLGAGRKLITTNPKVKHYPFYDAQNIYVIERGAIKFEEDFFKSDFKEINSDIRESMSLKGWVNEVFGISSITHWEPVLKQ
ncbi:lipopolysaccharide biosynthesis protein [Chryseobacterium sp. H1D6B]|uniref:glycosyltransferase family protein n=1 Tax=Chryseobacterium sp. H1D6B TaxID=2940588 RepID=UPI0015C8AEF9|nr:lipopolysaccharide biosynthesis protein [Chryseobacterium sp. H1D6B]